MYPFPTAPVCEHTLPSIHPLCQPRSQQTLSSSQYYSIPASSPSPSARAPVAVVVTTARTAVRWRGACWSPRSVSRTLSTMTTCCYGLS